MIKNKKVTAAFGGLAAVAATCITTTLVLNNAGNALAENYNDGPYHIVLNSTSNLIKDNDHNPVFKTAERGSDVGFHLSENATYTASDKVWGELSGPKSNSLKDIFTFGNASPITGIQSITINATANGFEADLKKSTGSGFYIAFGETQEELNPLTCQNIFQLNTGSVTYPGDFGVSFSDKQINYFAIGGLQTTASISSISIEYSCYEYKSEAYTTGVTITDEYGNPTGYFEQEPALYITYEGKGSEKKKNPLPYSIDLSAYRLQASYSDGGTSGLFEISESQVGDPDNDKHIHWGDDLAAKQGTAYRKTYDNVFVYDGVYSNPYVITVIDKTMFPTSAGIKFTYNDVDYIAYVNCDDENNKTLSVLEVTEGGYVDPGKAIIFTGGELTGENAYTYSFTGSVVTENDSMMQITIDYGDYSSSPVVYISGNWGSTIEIEHPIETKGLAGQIKSIDCEFDASKGSTLKMIPGMKFPLDVDFKTGEKMADGLGPEIFGIDVEVIQEGGKFITISDDGIVSADPNTPTSQGPFEATIRITANTALPDSSKRVVLDIPVVVNTELEFAPLPSYFEQNPDWYFKYMDQDDFTFNCNFFDYDGVGVMSMSCDNAKVKFEESAGLYHINEDKGLLWFVDPESFNWIELEMTKWGTFKVVKCSYKGSEILNNAEFHIVEKEVEDKFPQLFRQYKTFFFEYEDEDQGNVCIVANMDEFPGTGFSSCMYVGSKETDMGHWTISEDYDGTSTDVSFVHDNTGAIISLSINELDKTFYVNEVSEEEPSMLSNLTGLTFSALREFPEILTNQQSWVTNLGDEKTPIYVYLLFDPTDASVWVYQKEGKPYDGTQLFIDEGFNENFASFSLEDPAAYLEIVFTEGAVVLNADCTYESEVVIPAKTTFYPVEEKESVSFPSFFDSRTSWKWMYGDKKNKIEIWGNDTVNIVYDDEGQWNDPSTREEWQFSLVNVVVNENGYEGDLYFKNKNVESPTDSDLVIHYNEQSFSCVITSSTVQDVNWMQIGVFKPALDLPSLLLTPADSWVTTVDEANYFIVPDKIAQTITLSSPDGESSKPLSFVGLADTYLALFTDEDGSIIQLTLDADNHNFEVTNVFGADAYVEKWGAIVGCTFEGHFVSPDHLGVRDTYTVKYQNESTVLGTLNFVHQGSDIILNVTKGTDHYDGLKLEWSDGWFYCFSGTFDGEYRYVTISGVDGGTYMYVAESNIFEESPSGSQIFAWSEFPSAITDDKVYTATTHDWDAEGQPEIEIKMTFTTEYGNKVCHVTIGNETFDCPFQEYEGGTNCCIFGGTYNDQYYRFGVFTYVEGYENTLYVSFFEAHDASGEWIDFQGKVRWVCGQYFTLVTNE